MKFKSLKVIAMSMALMLAMPMSAFATPISLANSTESVATDTLDKANGTDYFADEDTNVWQDGEIIEETRITVSRTSQFEITIPKEVILDGSTGTADYKIKAKGDIAGDQKITVTPDARFTLSEAGGKADVTATVTQPNTEYVYTDLQGEGTEYNGNISATLTAGEWSGKFNFNINFLPTKYHEPNGYLAVYTTTNDDIQQVQKFTSFNDLKNFTKGNQTLKTLKIEDTYIEPVMTSSFNLLQNRDFDNSMKTFGLEKTKANLDASYMFYNCTNLTDINLDKFNTSNITNMSCMFKLCSKLTSINLKNFNTSNVTNMRDIFCDCVNLQDLYIDSFDTSNVVNMQGMFAGCQNITQINVSKFNTSNVVNMQGVFDNCRKLISIDLSSFNTAKVDNIARLFQNCCALTNLDLSTFNTTNITNTDRTFYNCSNLKTIYVSDAWNVSNVTSSSYMFYDCSLLTGAISYNSSKIDITYANYQTGYLKYKVAS